MDYKSLYQSWINSSYFNDETKEELLKIKDDEKEIQERFYKDLEFGTGGLRGIIGAGTNRINIYTVRKVTCGMANYLIKNKGEKGKKQGVVIAYDSRFKSREFCLEAAKTLAAYDIKSYIFNELKSTPELSFAVRELGCAMGIVITASHNPKDYNGYKVYGEDGGQVCLDEANAIINEVKSITDFSTMKIMDEKEAIDKKLINVLDISFDQKFIDNVKKQIIRQDIITNYGKNLSIIFTPLHGTGNKPVREVLKQVGFENVKVVEQQELPDSSFSTVKYPNPEEREAFDLAVEKAQRENSDLIIGTDPDCDRVGIVVKNQDEEYVALNGNQVGALLVRYIIEGLKEKNKLPKNSITIKTIVTSELGKDIANHYGVDCIDTLTGFKFIGEKITEFEEDKTEGKNNFLMGYEESYGYLVGRHVRDKDAVVATLLIAEMAAYYASKNMTIYDALLDMYEKFGYYQEGLKSITLQGIEGVNKIKEIMNYFKTSTIENIANTKVEELLDYSKGIDNLPKADVFKFILEDGSWIAVRPSGTEPKIKFYFGVKSTSQEKAQKKLELLKESILHIVDNI